MKTRGFYLSLCKLTGNYPNPSKIEGAKPMLNRPIKAFSVLSCVLFVIIIFPSLVHSEVLWEKELHSTKFIQTVETQLTVTDELYEYNGYYFILYFGMDPATAEIVMGKWKGNKYPALMKFDYNGNTIFQNEKAIPKIDSLVKAGVNISQYVRGNKFNNDKLIFDIPQTSGEDRTPNIYSFSAQDGNLNNIEGTIAMNYQYYQTLKSIFTDNEIFVLANGLLTFNQSRIDVQNQTGDEHGRTLKYRITLEMNSFIDSLQEDSFAQDFVMVNDHSFIVAFPGKDNKTIMAKYSYDKSEASDLPTGETITADLDWFTIYTDAAKNGFQKFILLDNGNLLVYHLNGSLAILDNNGKIIFNKVIFSDLYKNYFITSFMPLKYHTGYYAFWGYYTENKERDFAVLITDSDWNVVSDNKWDYSHKSNLVTDIKETENGNLIVFGNSLYIDSTASGLSSHYIPYYAEIQPNFVSVKDQNSNAQIEVSPNPAGDFITIKLGNINPMLKHGVDESTEIQIYNTLGEKVMSESIHPMTASHRMNIESLPKGMYFVKVGSESTKFVKI